MLETVAYNCLLGMPAIIMTLTVFAMYDLRKKYSKFYRTFNFVVAFWVQLVLIVKFTARIIMRIPLINSGMHYEHNKNDAAGSQFLQVMFGQVNRLNVKDGGSDMYQFVAVMFGIFCSQGWLSAKWFEIRDKTRDIHT
jgi:hypothetical protein